MTMKTTITARQARLIAQTLEALDALPDYADGQYLRVDLMDELFSDPIGRFTNEEGTWLFEIDQPAPKPPTFEEIAWVIFREDPEYYRDRKINFIKDLRTKWTAVTTEAMSLIDAKNTVEKVLADDTLTSLREKLIGHPADDYNSATTAYLDEDGDMAFARHRENMAERGTWFGVPGPMDEEPF